MPCSVFRRKMPIFSVLRGSLCFQPQLFHILSSSLRDDLYHSLCIILLISKPMFPGFFIESADVISALAVFGNTVELNVGGFLSRLSSCMYQCKVLASYTHISHL